MITCKRFRLKGVYRKLFGLEDADLHLADSDTLFLLDIIRIMVEF